jgi:hypothetical protein
MSFCKDGLIAGARDKKESAAVPIRLTSLPASLVPPSLVGAMRDGGKGLRSVLPNVTALSLFQPNLGNLLAN